MSKNLTFFFIIIILFVFLGLGAASGAYVYKQLTTFAAVEKDFDDPKTVFAAITKVNDNAPELPLDLRSVVPKATIQREQDVQNIFNAVIERVSEHSSSFSITCTAYNQNEEYLSTFRVVDDSLGFYNAEYRTPDCVVVLSNSLITSVREGVEPSAEQICRNIITNAAELNSRCNLLFSNNVFVAALRAIIRR